MELRAGGRILVAWPTDAADTVVWKRPADVQAQVVARILNEE